MSDYTPRPASPAPIIREIGFSDIRAALNAALADFRRAPFLSLLFGGVVALGGLGMLALLTAYRQPWLIIPLAIGFPLLGPFLAAGVYETCRRLDSGRPLILRDILGFMSGRGRHEFAWMAFVVLFIFWIWMYQARLMVALFMDMKAFASPQALTAALFTTGDGLMMLALGCLIGAVLAFVLFATTVVSMPLLVEREHDVVTAIMTSWRSVLSNFGPMMLWAGVVAGATFVSIALAFAPLLVVFPLLGFGTWRLYERVVAPLPA